MHNPCKCQHRTKSTEHSSLYRRFPSLHQKRLMSAKPKEYTSTSARIYIHGESSCGMRAWRAWARTKNSGLPLPPLQRAPILANNKPGWWQWNICNANKAVRLTVPLLQSRNQSPLHVHSWPGGHAIVGVSRRTTSRWKWRTKRLG